jgi:hypothetical protein
MRGSEKYKGKFPFKFFNCGRIGDFASKHPYNKVDKFEKQGDSINIRKPIILKRKALERKRKFYTFKRRVTHLMLVIVQMMNKIVLLSWRKKRKNFSSWLKTLQNKSMERLKVLVKKRCKS